VSHLGGIDEALTLAVECLERLHEVGERARLGRFIRLFVDRQDLLELVLLLACTHETSCRSYRHYAYAMANLGF